MVEKYNEFRENLKFAVVKLAPCEAVVCASLNFFPFTSGIGTMISALASYRETKFKLKVLFVGLLQFTCPIFSVGFLAGFFPWQALISCLGWIWSIVHGVWLIQASEGEADGLHGIEVEE